MARRNRRRLADAPWAQALLAVLVAGYIRLVFATGRWRIVAAEEARQLVDRRQPCIGAFWHGRLLMIPCLWRAMLRQAGREDLLAHSLISRHRDGEVIARTMDRLGFGAVRGSTTRGAAAAMRRILETLENGEYVALAPDGPRGPRMRAQIGAVFLASRAGCPIIPVTFSASRMRVLDSWDRFALPFPFARGEFVWGEPLHVPRDANAGALEAARLELERRLNELTAEADRRHGHAPVAPAPAEADAAPLREPA
jgi:lysophospholipid acyltransferase (LPLAT)-like uncharacterized protein